MSIISDEMKVDRTMATLRCPTPLDAWISLELKRTYAAALAEPVPDTLLRLLQDGCARR